MYKTTTKHIPNIPNLVRGLEDVGCGMPTNPMEINKLWQALNHLEETKKRRFLPASASITFANPSANTWRFHCLKSYLCLVRKQKGPGFLQKQGSLLAIDQRESHELQKVWHHRFVVFSSSTCSKFQPWIFWGVKHFESEPSMIRLPVVDRNPTKTTKFFYKEKVPLIIYIYNSLCIFAGSNPTRTSWKTSHFLHVDMLWRFFFRCLSPLVWHLLAAPGWTRSLDSTPLSHFRDPKISCHKISPTKKTVGCLGGYFRLLTRIDSFFLTQIESLALEFTEWFLSICLFEKWGWTQKRGGPWNPKWRVPPPKKWRSNLHELNLEKKGMKTAYGIGSGIYFATGVDSRCWSYCI